MAVEELESLDFETQDAEQAALIPAAEVRGQLAVAEVVDAETRPGREATLAFVRWCRANPLFTVVEYKRDAEGLYYPRPDGSRASLQ